MSESSRLENENHKSLSPQPLDIVLFLVFLSCLWLGASPLGESLLNFSRFNITIGTSLGSLKPTREVLQVSQLLFSLFWASVTSLFTFFFLSRTVERKYQKFAVGVLLIPAVVYFLGLAPALIGDDSSEFLIQSHELGISHPSGYPFYLLVGHLALTLTGNHLQSLSGLSALCSLAYLLLLFGLCRKLGTSATAAASAALLVALSPIVWRLGMMPEVYPMKNLCVLLSILLIWKFRFSKSLFALTATGLFFGATLGVYFGNVLYLPAFALFIFTLDHTLAFGTRCLRIICFGLGTLASGLIPAFYIYRVAQTHPPLGSSYNPVDFASLLNFLFANQYTRTFELTMSLKSLTPLAIHFAIIAIGLGGLGLAFAFIGMPRLLKKHRSISLGLFALITTEFIYFSFYNTDFELTSGLYIGLGVFVAGGIDSLLQRSRRTAIATLASVCLLASLQLSYFPYLFTIYRTSNQEKCTAFVDPLPNPSVLFVKWKCLTTLRAMQSLQNKYVDYEFYEFAWDPRFYRIADSIESFTPAEYLKSKLGKDKPVYVAVKKEKARWQCEECLIEPVSKLVSKWSYPKTPIEMRAK